MTGKRSRPSWKSFLADTSGAIAILAGITMSLLVLAAGTSLDLVRAHDIRTELQGAADAAALAAASQTSRNSGRVEIDGRAYFQANGIPASKATVTEPVVVHDTAAQTVTVSATATMDTSFLRIAQINTMNISVTATASYRGTQSANAEIVLAVDGSTSVNQTLWPDSRTRMNIEVINQGTAFITQVDTALGSDAKFGAVPFTSYVQVNAATAPAGIQDISLKGAPNCSCAQTPAPCEGGNYMCTGGLQSFWAGCVGPREASLLASVSNAADRPYPRVYGDCGFLRMTDLAPRSGTSSILNSVYINTVGNTFIPSGLIWAWNMLTPEIPFTKAAPNTDPNVMKVVVLISDGINSASPRYTSYSIKADVMAFGSTTGLHYTSRTQVDTLTRTVCQNMKDYGIKIYSVIVGPSDEAGKQLLRDCASDSSMSYQVLTRAETAGVFATLGRAVISAAQNGGGSGPPVLVR